MPDGREIGGVSSEALAPAGDTFWQKVGLLFTCLRGTVLFLWLRLRHRHVLRNIRPLALHLEHEVFPVLRENRQRWLTLEPQRRDDEVTLRGVCIEKEYVFVGTVDIAARLTQMGVISIRLDTQLEYGQIIEALLVLFYVWRDLPEAAPAATPYRGWARKRVADALRSPSGFHMYCSLMRFDAQQQCYEVQYSYCELFFTRAIRNYVEHKTAFGDHRVFFKAAPRAAVIAFLVFFLPPALLLSVSVRAGAALWLFFAVLNAAVIGIGLYAFGASQYTREHHDQLIQEYVKRVASLSRFPESNPSPIVKLDLKGNVLYMNPAGYRLLDELGLSPDVPEKMLPPDYRQIVNSCLEEGLCGYETEVRTRAHVLRYLFCPFTDERSVIAAASDVTYLKKIEAELRNLNQNLEAMVEARTEELQQTQEVTILCLGGLAEIRDPETGKHLERTRAYVKTLAERLREHPRFKDYLTDEQIEHLYKSVPLHDIGKVGVRDAILLKPGNLTPKEWEEMKRHTTYGGDTLRWAEERLGFESFLSTAREIAYYHHERWDGLGYPRGLKEEAIPIAARLMALADVYDALTTERVYKEEWPHEAARREIIEGRGARFDPAVVDAFLEAEDEYIRIAQTYAEEESAA